MGSCLHVENIPVRSIASFVRAPPLIKLIKKLSILLHTIFLPREVCPGFHVQDLHRLCVESAHVVFFEDGFKVSLA